MASRALGSLSVHDEQAKGAGQFFVEALAAERVGFLTRPPEGMEHPSGMPSRSVLPVDLEVAGQRFAALSGGQPFGPSPSIGRPGYGCGRR